MNNFKVGNFFRFKDFAPKHLVSNAVYLFKCRQCSAEYVGETSRHLSTRASEHRGLSSRTGKSLVNPPSSRIRDHALDCNHEILASDFKILKTCRTVDLKVTESVCIHLHKPGLNNHECSVPLNILA